MRLGRVEADCGAEEEGSPPEGISEGVLVPAGGTSRGASKHIYFTRRIISSSKDYLSRIISRNALEPFISKDVSPAFA